MKVLKRGWEAADSGEAATRSARAPARYLAWRSHGGVVPWASDVSSKTPGDLDNF